MTVSFEWVAQADHLLLRSPANRVFRLNMPISELRERLDHEDGDLLAALTEAGCVAASPRELELIRLVGGRLPATSRSVSVLADPAWTTEATWLTGHLGAIRVDGVEHADRVEGDVVVVLIEHFDADRFRSLDRTLTARGRRWLPVHITGHSAWIGPYVVAGETADYTDVLARRRAAAAGNWVDGLDFGFRPYDAAMMATPAERMWAAAEVALRVNRAVLGQKTGLESRELQIDFGTLTTRLHPVLPLPERFPASYAVEHGPEDVVDRRTGIVTVVENVEHHPSVPRRLRTVQSHVSDIRAFSRFSNNTTALGSTMDDEAAARGAAIGEAVERLCGNYVMPGVTFTASERELVADGQEHVSPSTFELFSDEQYRTPGFPFQPWSDDEDVSWNRGVNLTRSVTTAVPSFAVYVNWYGDDGAGEKPHQFMAYPGIAAGISLESALVSGIEEIIERDATMVWWLNGTPLPRLRPTDELTSVWDGRPRELGQDASMLYVPNRCEACGADRDSRAGRYLEAHERWEYDDARSMQILPRTADLERGRSTFI